MIPFPTEADVPEGQIARAPVPLRYEDVSQDGRMMLLPLTQTVSVAWSQLLLQHSPEEVARASGVVPIMVRFIVEGSPGPIGVIAAPQVDARYQFAHTVDSSGNVDRLLLNMWTRVEAPRGHTHGPQPDGAGEMIPVGWVFAEHVFTRPFAPAAERKVLRLEVPGLPAVPPDRHPWHPLEQTLVLPDGAALVDADYVADDTVTALGLMHTDSNQHVNSLVYPRLFEEAVLRRLATLGRSTLVLARRLEIGYRKPCFAGERVRVVLRVFTLGDRIGAAGVIASYTPDASAKPDVQKPHCYIQMLFDPAV